MNHFSIRMWIRLLVAVLAVSTLTSFYGLRLTSKGATFHFLEREYAVNLVTLAGVVDKAAAGEVQDKAAVIKALKHSHWISGHVDTEILGVEQFVFRALGFSKVIDLPYDSMRRVNALVTRVEGESSTQLTQALAKSLQPEMVELLRNGEDFAKEVSAAVSFVSLAARLSTGLCLMALALCIVQMGRSLVGPLEQAKFQAEALARGDLTVASGTPGGARGDELGAMMAALQHMQDTLKTVVSQVLDCSQSVVSGSSEIASGSTDLSQRTEEQASRLQQASAAMTQMVEAVKSNADSADSAHQVARLATDSAREGGTVMQGVMSTMTEIAEASKQIANIVSVIDGIAFQTNILALNAAVEAARAGEHGRGFAVVAGEVRTLAGRAAASAREIKVLIGTSVEKVETGSRLVDNAGESMKRIVDQVDQVQQLIADIAARVSKQSDGVTQISAAVSHLDDATQQNAALVEQSASASHSLKHQADKLGDAVSFFKLTA